MIIAVDFDGTCVSHEFPEIGKEIGAAEVLKELVANGHQLILWTMRSNVKEVTVTENDGNHLKEDVVAKPYLDEAVEWFKKHEIPLYGIQENPTQKNWTGSPKAYAQIYIDDAALGCPLIHPLEGRPYADWQTIRDHLVFKGLIKEDDD